MNLPNWWMGGVFSFLMLINVYDRLVSIKQHKLLCSLCGRILLRYITYQVHQIFFFIFSSGIVLLLPLWLQNKMKDMMNVNEITYCRGIKQLHHLLFVCVFLFCREI